MFLQFHSVIIAQESRPVRYLKPVFENIDIQKDIEFGQVTNFEGKTEKTVARCLHSPGRHPER